MNIKSFILPIATATAISATSANANLLFDIYAGATIGAGGATVGTKMFDSDKQKSYSAQSYGLVAGIDLPIVRGEIEYNMLHIDSSARVHIAMFNAYLKMPGLVVVNPYLGAGIGRTLETKGDMEQMSLKSENTTAYQIMAGLTFDVPTLPLKVDAEARALYASDFASVMGEDIDALHYDLRLKLRYIF